MTNKNYLIRKTKIEDKEAVNKAHIRSIREICSKDYRPDQIKAWSAVKYDDVIWKRSVEDEFHMVVEKNGKVEGLCHAKMHEDGVTGEIFGLYFTPDISGLGIGREVFKKMMDYLNEHSANKIVINATKSAKGFYEKMGFKSLDGAKDFNIRGIAVECFDMELIL